MAYASKEGRARVNPRSPQAAGQCDRCSFLFPHSHLRWQIDYSGAGLYNKRILVCENCYDTPQQQLKVIVIPPDPMPILNARPPDYVNAETNYRATYGDDYIHPIVGIPVFNGDIIGGTTYINSPNNLLLEANQGALTTEDVEILIELESATLVNILRVVQQTGEPPGGLNTTPGTNFNVPGNDDPGLPYDNIEIPKTGPL